MTAGRPSFFERAKKLVVYVVGAAAMLASAGVFDDKTEAIVLGVVSVLTGAGIYQVRNKPAGHVHNQEVSGV